MRLVADADPDNDKFPLKMRDSAQSAAFAYLRTKGLLPADDSDSDGAAPTARAAAWPGRDRATEGQRGWRRAQGGASGAVRVRRIGGGPSPRASLLTFPSPLPSRSPQTCPRTPRVSI